MKTKAFLILVTLGMFLAGCASTQQAAQQAGGNAPASTTSLVRALGSNAKANGATVTLTGEASVAKALVVPEGVTLNLTADNARLRLLDGATLTVNGTVNARGHGDQGKGWVEGNLYPEDGATVINGSGKINLKGKGQLLNIYGGGNGRKLTLDGVTLVGVEDNNQSLVDVNNGGEFVLKSGAITGNTKTVNDWASGGGLSVHKAKFTMEGGEISGNAAQGGESSNGGGVVIGEGSVFTMSGGAISGNTAQGGGGVSIGEKSIFVMSGGTISNNTASSTNSNSRGGGVRVFRGTFTMSDGTIIGNRSSSSEKFAMGGGVDMDTAIFTMSGGTISDNSAVGGGRDGGGGGGVAVISDDGTSLFTMKGGVISGNTASNGQGGNAGGVWARGGVTIIEGGVIYGDVNSLPAGTDASLANTARWVRSGAAIEVYVGSAKWGTGGTYTKGGVSQTGGSNITTTNDTLIAVPAR